MARSTILAQCFFLAALASPVFSQTTTLVSTGLAGSSADAPADAPCLSGDGRYVAFESSASNLVAGAFNGKTQVFVRDLATETTRVVSVSTGGDLGNDASHAPTISSDGRYVAFWSWADNLVAGDTNIVMDVFVHDCDTGVTERASVADDETQADAGSYGPALSADGMFVAFTSDATNLSALDGDSIHDIYVRDRSNGLTELVSLSSSEVKGDFHSDVAALSEDGRYVVFESGASNLVPGDTNNAFDCFVRDRVAGTTERVSLDSVETQANAESGNPAISEDGRYVAFWSWASNLVTGDVNVLRDVFVRDRTAGITVLVSVAGDGTQGDGESGFSVSPGLAISGKGRYVAFISAASNLIDSDTNGADDIFVHDREKATTRRVNLTSAGGQATDSSWYASISRGGRYVTFTSSAPLASPDVDFGPDVFVRDWCPASWSGYGTGLAGTLGVPSLTATGDPVLGTTIDVEIGNSLGAATPAALFVGFVRASIPGAWGGELLVSPSLVVPISLPAAGLSLPAVIPDDEALCGLSVFLQVLESDAGAPSGISASAGLELQLGVG